MILFVNHSIYSFAEKITKNNCANANIITHLCISHLGVNVDAKNITRFLRH